MSTDYEAIRHKNIKEYGAGTRHLSYFADIYSTRTHFIFEVLQNAEDALSRRPAGSPAGYVYLHLHSDRLEIRHNGAQFSDRDVNGICGIGEGTKADDFTQIGKFGIGFKSVYAYTFFPQIHSGDEHFEIRRFVEPHTIGRMEQKDTLIVLPFDQPNKRPKWAFREDISAEVAVREIGDAIRKLGIRTMLFLQHIEEIKWMLPDGVSGHFIRNFEPVADCEGLRKVEILDQDVRLEDWRIFERKVAVQDAGRHHRVTVEVAYLLAKGAVTRADNTELFVFFQTEKKTELGFLVQAPFKATKARDNIKSDDPANRLMIEAAAQLAADSLETLRDLGLLDVASFDALPLREKDFPEDGLFRPVYDKVREALKTKELLPAYGGDFVRADQAKLARGKELVTLFSPEQLAILFGGAKFDWLHEDITNDKQPDLHSYLIGITEGIQVLPKEIALRLTADFFAAQSEEWLIKFYSYLGKNFAVFQGTPFLRLDNGHHIVFDMPDKPNAYFPPSNAADIDQGIFPLVKQTVANKPEVSEFLRQTVKLREPDKIDVVIRCLLPKYEARNVTSDGDGYAQDLKDIATAYSSVRPNDATRLIDKLKETQFVAAAPASNPQSAIVWVKPSDPTLYLQSTELEQWFAGNEIDKAWFSLSVVGENLPDELKRKLGFAGGELIKTGSTLKWDITLRCYRRFEGEFDADAEIFGLEWAVRHPTKKRAIYLWNRLHEKLLLIRGRELRGQNKLFPVGSFKEFNHYSILGKICIDYAWLPIGDEYCKPTDVLLSALSNEFQQCRFAEALSRALGMRQPVDFSPIAKAFGMTPEEAQRRMIVTPEELTEIERHRQEKSSSPPLPDRTSPDLKRREGKITDEARSTPEKIRETRDRTIDPDYGGAQGDARTYLEHQYTNDDGVMFCQLCQAPQPVVLNGESHFEAVDCVMLNDKYGHHEQNKLALCPNHAAMYKNSDLTSDAIQHSLLDCEGQKIALNLAGNEVELYFTQQHLSDLRAVLNALPSDEI